MRLLTGFFIVLLSVSTRISMPQCDELHPGPDHGTSIGSDDIFAVKTPSHTSQNGFRIVLTGVAIAIGALLLLAGLLVQILVVHKFYFTPGALVTSAPLGPTLAIAHACSVVVSATVPIVLGLAAYYLSRDWLIASRVGGDNRPTPFQ